MSQMMEIGNAYSGGQSNYFYSFPEQVRQLLAAAFYFPIKV